MRCGGLAQAGVVHVAQGHDVLMRHGGQVARTTAAHANGTNVQPLVRPQHPSA